MPTSTLAQDCSSQEVNLQAGQQKKTSIQEKNFKKLQVSVKSTNDLEAGYMSPVVDSAQVLLKPMDNSQSFRLFDYDHPQKHDQMAYGQSNGHINNEYCAATYVPHHQGGNKTDSYVDLSQCEKENKRNLQYRQHQVTNTGHHRNVQTVTGHDQYLNQNHTHNNHCPVSVENCISQNHVCQKTRTSSKWRCSPLTCFIVAMLVLQLVWMGLFTWLLLDKMDHHSSHDDDYRIPNKGPIKHNGDDSPEITKKPPMPYQEPPHYPTLAPPMMKIPLTAVPTLGIKMEIDPSFLTSQGNTVMWTYPDERHLTGIEYHNGYFGVNVTGFYFVQSTLSLDHRPNNDKSSMKVRLNHCIKVDGRPKMDVCENRDLPSNKAGGSTVQDPMMYLEKGSSVHVSISHMIKIYDSVTENKFIMFLQRIA